jgi:hypothetical protein
MKRFIETREKAGSNGGYEFCARSTEVLPENGIIPRRSGDSDLIARKKPPGTLREAGCVDPQSEMSEAFNVNYTAATLQC